MCLQVGLRLEFELFLDSPHSLEYFLDHLAVSWSSLVSEDGIKIIFMLGVLIKIGCCSGWLADDVRECPVVALRSSSSARSSSFLVDLGTSWDAPPLVAPSRISAAMTLACHAPRLSQKPGVSGLACNTQRVRRD